MRLLFYIKMFCKKNKKVVIIYRISVILILQKRTFLFMRRIILFTCLSVFLSFNAFSQNFKYDYEELNKTSKKYDALMQLVEYFYVDKVDKPKLTEEAIVYVLKNLDPHSTYIPKDEVQRQKAPLEGSFDGIGVQFQIVKDTVLIIAPIVDGPSAKVGIMAGDKIVKINNEPAVGKKINNEYVFSKLRGPKGSIVTLGIWRKGQKEVLDFTIKRDKIPLYSVTAKYMIDKETGYIKLSQFARTSMDEFRAALSMLKSKGMKNLIFDLRDNPGGYMDIAYDLVDEFLPAGKLGVYTQGLKSKRQDYYTTSKGDFEKGKLIIMVDEGSASSSEIVAGGVQDWDRGLIIGRRTFGKGLVQRPFMLPDSSVIHLTVSRYYTPSGRNIQKPYENGSEDYALEVYKRMLHGEFMHADSIKFPDSLKFYTHAKRLVYGGGGIMPDYFIPADTSFVSAFYRDVSRKGLINDFRLQYMDENRDKLKNKYATFEVYKKDLRIGDEILDAFVKYADAKGVKPAAADMKISGNTIKTILRAMIAQDIFAENTYYEIISDIDNELQQAKQLMYDKKAFDKLTESN